MTKPAVSIGVPIFNAEEYLCAALDSLLGQTFSDFEIIISDNASTDQTEAISRTYLEKDRRIKYYRQPNNLGAEANFLFVLENSVGKYFMWAAADDIRSKDFIELNLKFLEKNMDYVCSVSPVKFQGRAFDERKMGDRSLEENRFDLRLRKFFGDWHANGAFYSLMRTEIIRNCEWVGKKFLGADWVIVLYLIRRGKLKRIPMGCLELGKNGVSNSGEIFRSYRFTYLDIIFPFWKMSLAVYQLSAGASIYSKLILLKECLVMNLWAIKLQLFGWLYQTYKSIKSKTF
jgi:glycosyltransferase involved in cell wall biosynthesis